MGIHFEQLQSTLWDVGIASVLDGNRDHSVVQCGRVSTMDQSGRDDRQKVWDLIKGAHSALLVTQGRDGWFDSRPMGCLQKEFDDTLWFMTFRHSPKVQEIKQDERVLVSYANPSAYEYVSLLGHARIDEHKHVLKKLWFEGLRVWFPKGPDDSEIALLSIRIEEAKYWTNASSVVTYAWAYVKARVTGQSPSPDQIAETKSIRWPR
jgi:general stress protein 26